MDNSIGILPRQNENALIGYPFDTTTEFNGFITDANFVQFDNFVPYITSIAVAADKITLSLTFDLTTLSVDLLYSTYNPSGGQVVLRDGTRYLGYLEIGPGIKFLWDNFTGSTIVRDLAFAAVTVRSIPSAAGVFSINSKFGVTTMNTDTSMFVNVSGHNVEINSVGFPAGVVANLLKTINGVPPLANNVTITDSEVLKIVPLVSSSIEFTLIGGNLQSILNQLYTVMPTKS